MPAQSLSPTDMRIILIILGLIVLALIYWFGKPGRRAQGRRRMRSPDEHKHGESARNGRVEPTLGGGAELDVDAEDDSIREPVQSELNVGSMYASDQIGNADQAAPLVRRAVTRPVRQLRGKRSDTHQPERIVSLLVVTREDEQRFHGPDIVVAAEKTGLEFGDLGIFHRLLEGKPELGPVFSAANMVEPGDFDMASIQQLETPGLSLFMTLPGPLPALDAWDTMLPTARRLAELLEGRIVDDQRNSLGRQRVAYIRDDLRAWDRKNQTSL